MSKRSKTPLKRRNTKAGRFVRDSVESIWRGIREDDIILWYAQAGWDETSRRPVYDYNLLVDTLINYGFDIACIFEFIDEFEKSKFCGGKDPIVMTDRHRCEIYGEVNRLSYAPCREQYGLSHGKPLE